MEGDDGITRTMVDAALEQWIGEDFPHWASMGEKWTDALRRRMRNALSAGIAAAPSGNGERG